MSNNARAAKRKFSNAAVGTSEADLVQVPSGKVWKIHRAFRRYSAQIGNPSVDIKWTDSANTLLAKIQIDPALTVGAVADELVAMRGAIMTNQDKVRAIRTGGTSCTLEFVLYVEEE
jgi:hypothetical protein